jgi:hypothetical protein
VAEADSWVFRTDRDELSATGASIVELPSRG